jgi:hypothetical protein
MSGVVNPPQDLPEPLPAGEQILWQGAPGWRALARDAFHVRAIAAYFAALILWRVVATSADGRELSATLVVGLELVGLGMAAIGVLTGIAWLIARTTAYTITNRRVVLQIGVALPMTINVPFRIVASAAFARHRDGVGDISLALTGRDRLAYLLLWPHVRPWRFTNAEPTLRGVADGEKVADILARAAAAATGAATQPRPDGMTPTPAAGAWPDATVTA